MSDILSVLQEKNQIDIVRGMSLCISDKLTEMHA